MKKREETAPRSILVVHGPNLNLLGTREPYLYGRETLDGINRRLAGTAKKAGAQLQTFQSNHEGALVDRVQHAGRGGGIIINPAAYTTPQRARDALAAVKIFPGGSSNIHAREPFAAIHTSPALSTICRLGSRHDLALEYALLPV